MFKRLDADMSRQIVDREQLSQINYLETYNIYYIAVFNRSLPADHPSVQVCAVRAPVIGNKSILPLELDLRMVRRNKPVIINYIARLVRSDLQHRDPVPSQDVFRKSGTSFGYFIDL